MENLVTDKKGQELVLRKLLARIFRDNAKHKNLYQLIFIANSTANSNNHRTKWLKAAPFI